MIRVLLVEDDPVIRDTTCYFLKSQQNFEAIHHPVHRLHFTCEFSIATLFQNLSAPLFSFLKMLFDILHL